MFRQIFNKLQTLPINNSICNYSTYNLLNINMCNGTKTITLSHQKTRNALSIAMMQELLCAIKENNHDPNLRAIVITAEGPIFSSGHNLKELGMGRETIENNFELSTELMTSIIKSEVPIIARVDGIAAAAGCQLVAQCDFAMCTEKSYFVTPGANFGVFCSTPGVAVSRIVPRSHTLHMLLTGSRKSAHEALKCGLVVKVTSNADELDKAISEACSEISVNSRSTIKQGRRTFFQHIDKDLSTAYQIAEKSMIEGCCSTDGQEGLNSFKEKRKPEWKHID